MRQVVGIDRKIKRAWLDAVLDRLVTTTKDAELRTFLDKHLKEELPGTQSRAKTSGIILRIWSGIPAERVSLRDRAVTMLPRISGQERIWLHWGMTALAYPFFRDTAEVVGRLLALQDDFTTAQVQGRMLTTWGDRATTKEAAQKLITTLVDWEVLRSTKMKGHFLLARKMKASIPDLQLWLLEALLIASAADEIEAQQLLRLPESFPFALSVGVADLRKHDGFNIHRQGLDMDMVALRKVKLQPPPKPSKNPKKGKKVKQYGPTLFDERAEELVSDNGNPDTILGVPVTAKAVDDLFAAPSAECVKQFRDGHYFGCIALAQVLVEAIVGQFWEMRFNQKVDQEWNFKKNIEALQKNKFISDDWKAQLDQMWANRRTFQHLRPSVESERNELEQMARTTLNILRQLNELLSNPSGVAVVGI